MFIGDNFIHNRDSAIDFLYSIGFDKFDIIEFSEHLNKDEDDIDWKAEAKAWEIESVNEFEKRNDLICEIQNLADELASGKGGTKVQYAQKLKDACEYWY